jgi:DNA-binding GntR family transcriptional regulator
MAGKISLKEKVYESVFEDILNYEFKPNQIINEKELMGKYHCSKSPVREALLSLCNDGVLRNIPRYGYEVIRLTREDIEDMLQFRYLLEGGLIKANIDKFYDAQMTKLEEHEKKNRLADQDVWTHWENNASFHLQLMSFTRNECAYAELSRVMNRLKRAYAQLYWNRWESVVHNDTRYHQEIIACIRERDTKQLLVSLKKDIQDFGDFTCEIMDFFE